MRAFVLLCVAAVPAHATTFYVTVAGLGGEQEYQQRFETWAKEIDKLLKASPDSDVRYHLRRNCDEGANCRRLSSLSPRKRKKVTRW